MAKMCDYYVDKSGKYFCILKKPLDNGEISSETYKEYCKYDDIKHCPIYRYYKEERK